MEWKWLFVIIDKLMKSPSFPPPTTTYEGRLQRGMPVKPFINAAGSGDPAYNGIDPVGRVTPRGGKCRVKPFRTPL